MRDVAPRGCDTIGELRIRNELQRDWHDPVQLEDRGPQLGARFAGANGNVARAPTHVGKKVEAAEVMLLGKLATLHDSQAMKSSKECREVSLAHLCEIVLCSRPVIPNGLCSG